MRFDDTLGMSPTTLCEKGEHITFGVDRTKTTGADKRTQTIQIFASRRAFLAVPDCLDEWLIILSSSSFAYSRDYLQPLPDVGMQARSCAELLTRMRWPLAERCSND